MPTDAELEPDTGTGAPASAAVVDSTRSSDAVASPPRRPWPFLGLVLVIAGALVGANTFGLRDRLTGSKAPAPRPVAVSRGGGGAPPPAVPDPQQSVLRSYPWWQTLSTFQGSQAPGTAPSFDIDPGAIQWRVKWSCTSGQIMVRASSEHDALVTASCPATGTGYGARTGPTTLSVASGGPWQLEVDQQVDVPLVEPPTAAMTALGTAVVATGTLYNVDQSGSGRVTFYRQPDATFALRLEGFFVTPNIDLEIRLSPLGAPHSTAEYLASPSVLVAPLDITTGSINFAVPAGVDPSKYHSLVMWCPTINSLYAAATLAAA